MSSCPHLGQSAHAACDLTHPRASWAPSPCRSYTGAGMKLVVFGLSISSSWGNGHATLWRGLVDALTALGHEVVFFERDLPYYAEHRDLPSLPAGRLILYPEWT